MLVCWFVGLCVCDGDYSKKQPIRLLADLDPRLGIFLCLFIIC